MANSEHVRLALGGEKNLQGFDLSGANLRRADLEYVNLTCAKLNWADLTGAKLTGADLSNVYLWCTVGNDKQIKNIPAIENCNHSEWDLVYTKTNLQIGCKNFTIEQWKNFSDREIDLLHLLDALEFWACNKEYIFDYIKNNPAIG